MQNVEIIQGALDEILSHFGISENELGSAPSYTNNFNDVAAYRNGDELVIGYIGDDNNPSNPLEDDGFFDLHRKSDSRRAFYEHLGRDCEGRLCDGLAESGDFKELWLRESMRSLEFLEFARNVLWCADAALVEQDLLSVAHAMQSRGSVAGRYLSDFSAYEKASSSAWKIQVSKHPDTRFSCPVIIDSNGGISVDGPDAFEDPECDVDQWDAVWVPCDDLIESINQRAAVYRFGIVDYGYEKGKTRWTARLRPDAGGFESPAFDRWLDAYQWLETYAELNELTEKLADVESCSLRVGEVDAAMAIAQLSLEEYGAYLKGDVYTLEYDTFHLEGDDAAWELRDSDSCCGFYNAEELASEIVATIHQMKDHDHKQAQNEAA